MVQTMDDLLINSFIELKFTEHAGPQGEGRYSSLIIVRKQLHFNESLVDLVSHVSEELVCFENGKSRRVDTRQYMECVSESIRGPSSEKGTFLMFLVSVIKRNYPRFSVRGSDGNLCSRIHTYQSTLAPPLLWVLFCGSNKTRGKGHLSMYCFSIFHF